MTDNILDRLQAEPIHAEHAAARRRRVGDYIFVSVCILIISFIALPPIYASAPIDVPFFTMLHGAMLLHILVNCAANALVMIGALFAKGERLDRKLANVLSNVLVVHGALAFIILVARQPYSNLILPMSVLVSIVGGSLVMLVQHKSVAPRVAIIGRIDDALDTSGLGPHDRVIDSSVDLRNYDVLLTGSVSDLSPAWATTISRAMLTGKPIRHLAEYDEERRGLVSIDHFDLEHLPAGGLTSYRMRKRVLDIALVVGTAPVTVPLLLIAMVLIVCTSGRPVMFNQDRTGMGNRAFRMYKLRTMRPLAKDGAAKATLKGDVRITPVGHILRRYRVDELPQLWNVLKGDMSIIGPRPEWTVLSQEYMNDLPAYAYRSLVRPGITGWAQVRGGYASDLAETRVKLGYDLFYIKNLAFSMDMQILVRTVWTLVTGRGAR